MALLDEVPCPEGMRHALKAYEARNWLRERDVEEWLWNVIKAYNDTATKRKLHLTVGKLTLNVDMREVYYDGKLCNFTPREFELLWYFMEQAQGKVLEHRRILKIVWGPAHVDDFQYLRVYMAQIREKTHPNVIVAVAGVGYRLGTAEEQEMESLVQAGHNKYGDAA